MCDPGKRVKKHCDENTSTMCDSCPAMTYTDAPNGLTECLPCFVCDSSNGLRVKHACTSISNTVCEPLAGFYCIDLLSNCKKAMKHSTCSPGQYVNQAGTEFSDTVCDDCPAGSYSDGTFCKLHTKSPDFVGKFSSFLTCNNAEYEINGECCPMCDPGKRVKKHCDENTSTMCDSCPAMTYTDAPNGLAECLPCFVCDSSNGLRVKHACTSISNTVCEPLPGFYCIDLLSNCKKAMKHSTCSPGQYVNQAGTEFSDTVCNDCPAGSYSDGTFCKLHTKCESLGKTTVKAGTETSDVECSNGIEPTY
ncbi:tumor necrosis factor receptor superfamily member 14-like [Labeo rohita]|uniref:tumor necrosis factor receptor superfamily member 14-like n=1 Tax=Labeo rohita TaxID=84645 RepID=UPI0021E249A7|nr:tumor necrosis factor receptor superfamily member 14-like [Labeo rohita]